eukprot:UN00715
MHICVIFLVCCSFAFGIDEKLSTQEQFIWNTVRKADQFPIGELKHVIKEFAALPAALKQPGSISVSIDELQRRYDNRMKQINAHNTNYQRIRFRIDHRINQTWIFERDINAEYEFKPLVERKAFLIMKTIYPVHDNDFMTVKEVTIDINRNSRRFEIKEPYQNKVSTCYFMGCLSRTI